MAINIPEDTTFTFDVPGRYGCNTWEEAKDSQDTALHDDARPFDFVVIGGGSFGAVAAARVFNADKTHSHRVLVLEAGPLVFGEHVQNLPSGFELPSKNKPGTVWGQPWESDSPMGFNQDFPGLAFCVGGRSLFWGGWSPYFIDSELADPSWPASVKQDLTTPVVPRNNPRESYLDLAARQIGTSQTNDFVFGPLHDAMRKLLFAKLSARTPGPADDVLTGNRGALALAEHLEAPLAVQSSSPRPGFFALNKFNGVQLLLRASRVAQAEADQAGSGDAATVAVKKRLMVVDNTRALSLERQGSRVTGVRVKLRGGVTATIPVKGQVILALGTIENTRLALNAVPESPRIGRNLMVHLRSNLTFRVPRAAFGDDLDPDKQADPAKKELLRELQVSALFVKGIHTHADGSKGHYHLQITASGVGSLGMNSEAELFRKIPNIEELDQFRDLTDPYVVVTLRGIGETVGDKSSADPQNRVARGAPDGDGVPRATVRLEAQPRDASDPRGTRDVDLWKAMNQTCREVAALFDDGQGIEYLSRPNRADLSVWQALPPADDAMMDTMCSTHHEAGTLWMGDAPGTSVTDEWGRLWELDNVYAVGPALLPTIGSPNPMLSGVALTRRTADHLIPLPARPPVEAGYKALFDGTEGTFQKWKLAGAFINPGHFALVDGLLVAQPQGDHALLYYAAERFGDFTLRLQFRLAGPTDAFGKAEDNAGVFVRFRYPNASWPDVSARTPQADQNPAWVAVDTGFEVQIDERGRPRYFNKHRTGAIYDVPAGDVVDGVTEPALQTFTPGPVLEPGRWYEFEISVSHARFTVGLRDANDDVNVLPTGAFQTLTDFTKPGGAPYAHRGLPPQADPRSGYIGVQAHTQKVAFRNVRILPAQAGGVIAAPAPSPRWDLEEEWY